MACGYCGGGAANPTKYEVTLEDGTKRTFLTETEARIFATSHGGGSIARITT